MPEHTAEPREQASALPIQRLRSRQQFQVAMAGSPVARTAPFVLHRRRKDWRQVQRRAMAQRHDWGVAADATLGVYRQALHERG